MGKDSASGNAPAVGRAAFDVKDNILWTQRILKEEARQAQGKQCTFSVRAAVSVADVPAKFKPGHVDPRDGFSSKGFDPTTCGWDPAGPEATEFRRAMRTKTSQPQLRHPYPETMQQDTGWVLAPVGDAAERLHKRKLRYGIGWPDVPPDQWSASTALVPPVPVVDADSEVRTQLSVVAPSVLSMTAPSSLFAQVPRDTSSELARAPASRLLGCPPVVSSSASNLSRATSLPALTTNVVERLRQRERKVARALQESREYLCCGPRGSKWSHPLGQTDVTRFANDFAKATGGVPLYKYG